MVKRAVRVCLTILVLGLILSLLLYMYGYPRAPEQWFHFPDTGIWVCEELGITLYRDERYATIEIHGQVIRCDCWLERGDDDIYIDCNERDNSKYEYRHRFFHGTILETEENVLLIQEYGSKNVYAFRLVTDVF